MRFILVFLFLTYTLLSDTCTIKSFDTSKKLSNGFVSIKVDNNIPFIQSSQGHEAIFYYSKTNNQLHYVKIFIYGEIGQTKIELLYHNNGNVETKSTEEFYNTHIYEGNIRVVSRNIEIFPICKQIPNSLFYGIKKDKYKKMVQFAKNIKSFFRKEVVKNNITSLPNKKLVEILKKEIQQKNIQCKYNKKTDKNNIFHTYPQDINSYFNDYMKKLDKNSTQDIVNTIKQDCRKTGEGSLVWSVLTNTKNYISLKLEEGYSFCYPSFVLLTKYINLLYVNQKLYRVYLSDSIKKNTKKILWKEEDCIPSKETILEKQLISKDNNMYMRVFYGKVCSQDISLKLIENNFIFTEINQDLNSSKE